MAFLGLRGVIAAALASATLLFAGDAPAFCRTTTAPLPPSYNPTGGCYDKGIVLYWKNSCVGYSIQEDAAPDIPFADATRVIDAAFATWADADCAGGGKVGIAGKNLGAVECASVKYNQEGGNQNLIVFRSDTWPYNDANNTLGLTTVTFNADTGEIYDADLEINAAQKNLTIAEPVPATGFDLQSVVTHEVGHFFGLAHATAPTSTMYAAYKPGTSTLRSLAADDIAGICAIYPSTSQRLAQTGLVPAGPCDPSPRRGLSSTCDGASTSSGGTGTSSGGCAVARARSPSQAAGSFGVVLAAFAFALVRRRARRVL
jgi:hypothetical protein